MAVLTWGPAHSVRVRPIDEQHKKLMNSVNKLCEAIVASDDSQNLDHAFAELQANARLHFLEEQARHRAQQERLAHAIAEFKRQSETSAPLATTQLIHFLRDWLQLHIQISQAALDIALREAENDSVSAAQDAA